MVLNFQVDTKTNKGGVKYKTVKITNNGKKQNVSYKTIKMMYKTLLNEGYKKNDISINVNGIDKHKTIKSFDDDMYDTLDDYYKNSVKNDSKFKVFNSAVFYIVE